MCYFFLWMYTALFNCIRTIPRGSTWQHIFLRDMSVHVYRLHPRVDNRGDPQIFTLLAGKFAYFKQILRCSQSIHALRSWRGTLHVWHTSGTSRVAHQWNIARMPHHTGTLAHSHTLSRTRAHTHTWHTPTHVRTHTHQDSKQTRASTR